MRSETRYARSGEASIAYQVIGDGPIDLVLVPGFVSHLEVAWEEPSLAHLLTRLASFSRLILFDKRATGLSDPIAQPPSMRERMDDIRAVMEAVGSQQPALLGISEGGTLGISFAHTHPDQTRALITYGSWARRVAGPDYPWGPSDDELERLLGLMERGWATGEWWTVVGRPSSWSADPVRYAAPPCWWARYLRMAASPTMAQDLIRMNVRLDIRELLPRSPRRR